MALTKTETIAIGVVTGSIVFIILLMVLFYHRNKKLTPGTSASGGALSR